MTAIPWWEGWSWWSWPLARWTPEPVLSLRNFKALGQRTEVRKRQQTSIQPASRDAAGHKGKQCNWPVEKVRLCNRIVGHLRRSACFVSAASKKSVLWCFVMRICFEMRDLALLYLQTFSIWETLAISISDWYLINLAEWYLIALRIRSFLESLPKSRWVLKK